MFDVNALLIWVVSGGGAGVVAYTLMDKVPQLASIKPEMKRYVAALLTTLVACGGFFLSGWFGAWVGPTLAQPVTPQEWVIALLWVAGTANGWASVIHARRDLSKH